MSLAEKADTAAVSFSLNRIFFFLAVHVEKVSWNSLKIKGFAHLKAPPVLQCPLLPPWEITISFFPAV